VSSVIKLQFFYKRRERVPSSGPMQQLLSRLVPAEVTSYQLKSPDTLIKLFVLSSILVKEEILEGPG